MPLHKSPNKTTEKSKHKKRLLWLKIGIGVFLFLLALGAGAFYELAQLAKNLPDPQQAIDWQMTQSTKIYDRTGQVLLYEMNNNGRRTVISFDQIPDYVKQATLAIEDKDFYNHSALDWKSIGRAIITDISTGQLSQGASTITQQLARNAFLTTEKTFTRKIKEAILSYWIEKYYSKDKIFELYLNEIPYGSGNYGIEAASQAYFGKSAKDLTLVEAATLAAIPQSPTYYSPWNNHIPDLMQRKNNILDQMYQLGYIDKEERDRNVKITPTFLQKNLGSIKAPHFVMMIRDYLLNKYGEDAVNRGGLKVITTLDWNLQQIAEKAVTEGAKRNAELYKGNNAALVAQDPKTGQILALVGSADYFDTANEGNFNVATQGLRQPGSSIKPFIYITAFKQGYSPDSVIMNLPTEFSSKPDCPITGINYSVDNPDCYHPQNFDHQFPGPVTLRNALAQSMNIPAVKLLYLVGINNALQTASDFGITTLNDPSRYGLSLVLGGGEVKLVDMVEGYSVFSQEGVRHDQTSILEVDDYNGNVLEKYLDKATQVIEPQYARMINDVLSDQAARKPLYSGSFGLTVFQDRDVALKTGTTDAYKDAWTIGYTPYLVAGVWAGNNHEESMQQNAGSILAAVPIWNAFMVDALKEFPNESFNKPDPVVETKPMLNGQFFVNGQVHDILYYVDKNNPTDAAPQNPANDPQYNNWEIPTQIWAQQNSLILPYLQQSLSSQ